jgi:hypothetical protein
MCSYNKPSWLQYFRGHQPLEPNRRRRRRRRKRRRRKEEEKEKLLKRPRL